MDREVTPSSTTTGITAVLNIMLALYHVIDQGPGHYLVTTSWERVGRIGLGWKLMMSNGRDGGGGRGVLVTS